jgi:hypothetical protein
VQPELVLLAPSEQLEQLEFKVQLVSVKSAQLDLARLGLQEFKGQQEQLAQAQLEQLELERKARLEQLE